MKKYRPEIRWLLDDSHKAEAHKTARCCEAGIVRAGKGFEHDGNKWTCACGTMWMYIEEYPEGGYWMEWSRYDQ